MSELALTLARFTFLGLLWLFVIFALLALRKDLRGAGAQPTGGDSSASSARTQRSSRSRRSGRASRRSKVKGTRLVVVEGPLEGAEIPLEGAQITLGRAPDSTIVIDDDYASSRHARIYESEGAWVVEDLGSTNGTWIDRTRLTTPTVLPIGAPLRVGRTTLQIQK
ncbi:MAG TPA: FHA domain-containing protein [Candidatus Nanopelagicales bacterium]|nr:FHA domain-containing protein [Candidatus Nanopelagicales bacterium]